MCLQRLHVFQLYYHKQGQKSKPGNHPVVDVLMVLVVMMMLMLMMMILMLMFHWNQPVLTHTPTVQLQAVCASEKRAKCAQSTFSNENARWAHFQMALIFKTVMVTDAGIARPPVRASSIPL